MCAHQLPSLLVHDMGGAHHSIALYALYGGYLRAQVANMADGTWAGCSGVLTDSGGEGGVGYSANEDLVLVVCPDVAGSAIALDWTALSLSLEGAAPVDRLHA